MAENPASVSAFIICKNEGAFITDCLESVAFCADIVVVDSGSTDDTLDRIEQCRNAGMPIRLFQRDWPGYSAQKQFALEQCTQPWCLNLDADERVDTDLAAFIAALPADGEGCPQAYELARCDWLPGYGYPPRWVHRHGVLRLVRNGKARYNGLAVHEGMLIDGQQARARRGELRHFRNISLSADIGKINSYSSLKARERIAQGAKGNFINVLIKPLSQFLKVYLLQRYVVCGTAGFIYAVMLAIYVFHAEAKLWRMSRDVKLPDE